MVVVTMLVVITELVVVSGGVVVFVPERIDDIKKYMMYNI